MPRDRDIVARELLVVRCRRGDRAAWEELVRAWEGRLLYFVRRLVREEADAWDVLQKTWVRVLAGIGSLDDPNWNRRQFYTVTRVKNGHRKVLAGGLACPPCNIGPGSTPSCATSAA